MRSPAKHGAGAFRFGGAIRLEGRIDQNGPSSITAVENKWRTMRLKMHAVTVAGRINVIVF